MTKYDLTPKQREFFLNAYSRTPDSELVRKLELVDPFSHNEISQHCIKVNARRYHLKKDLTAIHKYEFDLKLKEVWREIIIYNGDPMIEIHRILPADCSIILLFSKKEIKALKTACWRFNHGEGLETGVQINGMYDFERLLAILTAKPISPCSCTSPISPAGAQCAPP